MAFTDSLALIADNEFRNRVTLAAVLAANNIAGETRSESGHDTYYDRRHGLAVQVLNAPTAMTDRFVWSVASNPAVGPGATDNDIQFTVNSYWDHIAGVSAAEAP